MNTPLQVATDHEHTHWLKRGRQRRAIAQVLRKPMTASQIWEQAVLLAPQIQLRDVSTLLRKFEARKLVRCLNRGEAIGHLYCLTDAGREAVEAVFAMPLAPLPEDVDWNVYSLVVRGPVRRLVVTELANPKYKSGQDATAASLRRNLLTRSPMGLAWMICTLQDLARFGVIECYGRTVKRQQKLYRLTSAGERIVRELKR